MEPNCLLVRYGESFLKGKNRSTFIKKLIQNISAITGQKQARHFQGRIALAYFSHHHVIRRVFGLTSYSPAVRVDKDMEQIQNSAVTLLQNHKGTFKIETRRSDKAFPLTSPEINRAIGIHIEAQLPLEFSFSASEITLHIEINQEGVYLFTEIIPCFGGFPTGVAGKVHLLVEHEADLLAGLLMMKRGCTVIPVCVSNSVDTSLLQKFSPTKIKSVVMDKSEPYSSLQKNGAVLVSGETFETKKNYLGIVFKPLIAYAGDQIKAQIQEYRCS